MSPVVDDPVDKVDGESLGINVQSMDPPGFLKFVAHGVVGEGPLHVDKSSYLCPTFDTLFENQGNNSSPLSNSMDSFNDCWANNVSQISDRPRKRKRSKHGEYNSFEDLLGYNIGPNVSFGQQDRIVDSTEKGLRIFKIRWGSLIRMGSLRKIPLL
ncbi:hypothetical protein Hanom_Chr08g00737441 [Helianthus anomalus]